MWTDTLPTYTVIVTANKLCDGDRLDRVLSVELPELSRTRIQELISAGKVERAGWGTLLDSDIRVKQGDILHVNVPPSVSAAPEPEPIPLTIVFEDRSVVVIDKPPKLVVHPGSGNWRGTLVNAAAARYARGLPAIKGRDRPGIVHRLDKDTSGLMVLAKTEKAFHHLAEQFATHTIERLYLAVTWGHPTPTTGRIYSKLGRSEKDRHLMANVPAGGKQAETCYDTVRLLGTTGAVIACRPATGRTHQIRVHLASIGCPIVGDELYGRGRNGRLEEYVKRGSFDAHHLRQALHAHVIGFRHPDTHALVRFSSSVPSDINSLCNALEDM